MAVDQQLVDQLKEKFGSHVLDARLDVIDPWVEVSPEGLCDIAIYLRDDLNLRYDLLNCISSRRN